MATLASLVVDVTANTRGLRTGLRGATGSVRSFHGSLARMAALAGGGFGLIKAAKFIVNTNRAFEKLNAQLHTMQGSAAGARAAFKNIEKLASTTPFQIEELAASFVTLRTIGVEPTNESMTSLGNFASSMSRNITDVTAAVRSAAARQTESLRLMGIETSIQGDMITLAYQGMAIESDLSATSIVESLAKISDANFAGAMAREMDTLNGIISNTQDNLGIIARKIGESVMPVIKDWAAAIRDAAAGQGGFVQDTVRGIGTIIEQMGKAIVFVSGHEIMAKGGLVGLMLFGGQKALVLASVGAALDELTKVLFGSTTEFGKAAENVVRLEEELARLKRSTFSTNAEIFAIQDQLVLAQRTLDGMTERAIEGTTVLGGLGQGFITAGQGLQEFTFAAGELPSTMGAAGASLANFGKQVSDLQQGVQGAFSGLVVSMRDVFRQMEDDERTTLARMAEAVQQFAASVERTMLELAAKELGKKLFGSLSGEGGLGVGGALAIIGGSILSSVFHSGGVVGRGGPSRMVPASAFAGAPSFAGGGIAGLGSQEVPAILHKGETVLPVGARGGSGGTVIVNQEINLVVNAMDGRTVSHVLKEQSGTIAQIVFDAAQDGAGFRRGLRGR